ncbi:hypothetical protein HWV62_8283 [Athelia sp. TMB]|nr:hypothetical protein HWV62_8283 [Athelia sp. TMB]
MMNTNVIELYSHILKGEDDDEQLTYYDSGIGTYARPSWRSFAYLKQVAANKIDLAIAWNLEKIIIGFSRGAFQVRALAGMIETSGDIPLSWMRNEAIKAGLRLKPVDINWKSQDLERPPTESLTFVWKLLEQLPIARLSYKGRTRVSHKPHRGKSRKIVEGQKIHASVIFRPKYHPLPAFPKDLGTWPAQLHWGDPDRHTRLDQLDGIWEKELFDYSSAASLFTQLAPDTKDIPIQDSVCLGILERIAFMASSPEGRNAMKLELQENSSTLARYMDIEFDSFERIAIKLCAATAYSFSIKDPKDTIPTPTPVQPRRTIQPEVSSMPKMTIHSSCLSLAIVVLAVEARKESDPEAHRSSRIMASVWDRLGVRDINKAPESPHASEHVSTQAVQDLDGKRPEDSELLQLATVLDIVSEQSSQDVDKLRMLASLAVASFASHTTIRETMIEKDVPRRLINLCQDPSENVSTTAAQALLHMLGFGQWASFCSEVLDLKSHVKADVADNIANSVAPNEDEVVKILNIATGQDALHKPLLQAEIITYLIQSTMSQTDQRKRKACMAALITFSRVSDEMRSKMIDGQIIPNLMEQLLDEETDIEAQGALVSLYMQKGPTFKKPIIEAGFIDTLIKRLGKQATFCTAANTLHNLMQDESFREKLLSPEPLFTYPLVHAIAKGGIDLEDLGDALGKFCEKASIRQELIKSDLVDMIKDTVRDGSLFAVTFIPAILSGVGAYGQNASIR